MTTKQLPRGLRNNNPGNIRHSSDVFQGEVPGSDREFKTFQNISYGYRALLRVLTTYITKYSCNTVGKIINRWAPPSENNTDAYIRSVCTRTEMTPTTVVSHLNRDQMIGIASAISKHENWMEPNVGEIETGWKLLNGYGYENSFYNHRGIASAVWMQTVATGDHIEESLQAGGETGVGGRC